MAENTNGLVTMNGNILSVVDTETTGLIPGYHEIVQIAIVPLNSDFDPLPGVSPFYMNIKPDFPDRADPIAMRVNGLKLDVLKKCPDRWQVADALNDWFNELNLPMYKKLIYLTQNAPFDIPFLRFWLGEKGFDQFFHRRGRDTMFTANAINDRASYRCQEIPFPTTSLESICNKFGICNDGAHDALSDCLRTGKAYREMMRMDF